jgi:uncharacterized HhH-GPD family protein
MTQPLAVPVVPVTDPGSAFAFVLGVLFNQRMRADDAWRAPWELGRRVGALTPAAFLALDPGEFAAQFAAVPAIHPFTRTMAERAYRAAELVDAEYDGDARRIWTGVTAAQFLARLQAFPGIGRHKATVALFIATRELGITVGADGHSYSISCCGSLADRYHPHHEPLLT